MEDFTYRIQVQHFPNGTHNTSLLHHLTPFRALLQLYAYEEVFTNHKLDRAFGGDDDMADLTLTFYAPQLLCFLLHNAFLNTGRLERWILRKCQSNVYFAHKCYWFIRSWCLHSITLGQESNEAVLSTNTGYNVSSDSPSKGGLEGRGTGSTTSLSSLLDGWGRKSASDGNEDGIVTADERQLMITLLGKIMVRFIFFLGSILRMAHKYNSAGISYFLVLIVEMWRSSCREIGTW